MPLKALLLGAAAAAVLHAPLAAAEHAGVPHGWTATPTVGKIYAVGYDNKLGATYLRNSTPTEEVAALSQTVDAKPYAGQAMVMTAEVRNDNFQGRAEMFLRGVGRGILCISSITPQPGAWQKVRLDVNFGNSEENKALNAVNLGFAARGTGKLWFRNVQVRTLSEAETQSQTKQSEPLTAHVELARQNPALDNLTMQP